MQNSLVEEIGVICNIIQNKKDFYQQHAKLKPMSIDIVLKSEMEYMGEVKKVSGKKKFQQYIDLLNKNKEKKSIAAIVLRKGEVDDQLIELKSKLAYKLPKPFSIYYNEDSSSMIIDTALDDSILSLRFSSKRVQSSTAHIFIAWMLGASILLYAIAILFMRNQLKSISQLAEFADELGKGHKMEAFKPSGAAEIKNAGEAIILMRDRIARQINYRTEMLAHISHDLRTPLTRMKLQVAMLTDKKAVSQLDYNIGEIEHMIGGYLDFAKEEGNEASEKIDILALVEEAVLAYNNNKLSFVCGKLKQKMMAMRKHAVKRALNNLINNGLKYCKDRVVITLSVDDHGAVILVEDDGVGISNAMREDVFKPFFKVKKEGEGYGLGLTIVKSIVQSHGGKIDLGKSSLGGLKAKVIIPI